MSQPSTGTVRLQKFLAEAGLASRRKAEEIIQSGRVKVNGAVVKELGTKVDPGRDLVVVDGQPVERAGQRRYILLYKPPGCVTTLSDPQGRPTARGYLAGVEERVFPVGRLDYDAEGALLFTDDGELANRLAHPRYGHRRVYLVKTKGVPDEARAAAHGGGGPARGRPGQGAERRDPREGRDQHLDQDRGGGGALPPGEAALRVGGAAGAAALPAGVRRRHGGAASPRPLARPHRRGGPDHARRRGDGGGRAGRTALAHELPKAGRRHGHGPPPQAATHAGTKRPGHAGDQRAFEENNPPSGRPGRSGRPERRVAKRPGVRPHRAPAAQAARARSGERRGATGSGRRPERAAHRAPAHTKRPERSSGTERPGRARAVRSARRRPAGAIAPSAGIVRAVRPGGR